LLRGNYETPKNAIKKKSNQTTREKKKKKTDEKKGKFFVMSPDGLSRFFFPVFLNSLVTKNAFEKFDEKIKIKQK
jgi:hypothetical protein